MALGDLVFRTLCAAALCRVTSSWIHTGALSLQLWPSLHPKGSFSQRFLSQSAWTGNHPGILWWEQPGLGGNQQPRPSPHSAEKTLLWSWRSALVLAAQLLQEEIVWWEWGLGVWGGGAWDESLISPAVSQFTSGHHVQTHTHKVIARITCLV